ncbi:MAG TPA: alpha/beta hydrolase [Acidimicrobiales bacterium]|nr:alpha/beta hydrolase [Acidimicrobiales bacterium]
MARWVRSHGAAVAVVTVTVVLVALALAVRPGALPGPTAHVSVPAPTAPRATGRPTTSAWPAAPASGEVPAIAYGPLPYQLLDLYLPDRAAFPGVAPVIVYLHGGGWVGGSRSNVDPSCRAEVARGYGVASVDYLLATPGAAGSFPGAVSDAKLAIRFVKVHAAQWSLDPSRVVVMGDSAGGYLAAFVAATRGAFEPVVAGPLAVTDSSVAGVVDVVGITDLPTFATTAHPWAAPLTASFLGCPLVGGRAACSSASLAAASVAPYVDATAPPILLAYGGADALVVASTQGRPLATVWSRAHEGDPGAVTYLEVQGAGHNLSPAQLGGTLTAFLDRVSGF